MRLVTRRHQSAIAGLGGDLRFVDEVVDLILDRLDLDRGSIRPVGRITCSATPRRGFHLPIAGVAETKVVCGRIASHSLTARAGCRCSRQSEAIFGERDLAPVIALGHRPDLAARSGGFHRRTAGISGRISNRLARLAGQPAVRSANNPIPAQLPVAAIISRSKLVRCSSRCASTSGLPRPIPSAVRQARAGSPRSLFQRRPGRHIMRIGEHPDGVQRCGFLAGQGIEFDDDSPRRQRRKRATRYLHNATEDFQIVALHPKIAAPEASVVALVLQRHHLRMISLWSRSAPSSNRRSSPSKSRPSRCRRGTTRRRR